MTTLISTPEAPDQRAAELRRLPEYEPDRASGLLAASPAPGSAPDAARAGGAHAPSPPGRRPEREHVGQLLQLVVEVLNRRRPAAQLRGKLTSAAYAALCTAIADPYAPRGYRLRRFRLTRPAESAIEVFGTVARGERTHALVARLDLTEGRWACSSVTVL
jgi:hypothetical protein